METKVDEMVVTTEENEMENVASRSKATDVALAAGAVVVIGAVCTLAYNKLLCPLGRKAKGYVQAKAAARKAKSKGPLDDEYPKNEFDDIQPD